MFNSVKRTVAMRQTALTDNIDRSATVGQPRQNSGAPGFVQILVNIDLIIIFNRVMWWHNI